MSRRPSEDSDEPENYLFADYYRNNVSPLLQVPNRIPFLSNILNTVRPLQQETTNDEAPVRKPATKRLKTADEEAVDAAYSMSQLSSVSAVSSDATSKGHRSQDDCWNWKPASRNVVDDNENFQARQHRQTRVPQGHEKNPTPPHVTPYACAPNSPFVEDNTPAKSSAVSTYAGFSTPSFHPSFMQASAFAPTPRVDSAGASLIGSETSEYYNSKLPSLKETDKSATTTAGHEKKKPLPPIQPFVSRFHGAVSKKDVEARDRARNALINSANLLTDVQYDLVEVRSSSGKVLVQPVLKSLFNNANLLKSWRVDDLRKLAAKFGITGTKNFKKEKFAEKFAEAAYAKKLDDEFESKRARDVSLEDPDDDSDVDTGSVTGNKKSDSRAPKKTKNCFYRLVNVLFSADHRASFQRLGSNQGRAVLDAGLAGRDQHFWSNVGTAFRSNDNGDQDFIDGVNSQHPAVLKAFIDPSIIQEHSDMKLRDIYHAGKADYKKAKARITASGNGSSDFWSFCDGKLEALYLEEMNKSFGNASLENAMLRYLPKQAIGQTTQPSNQVENQEDNRASAPKKDPPLSAKKKFDSLMDVVKQGFADTGGNDEAKNARATMFEEQRSILEKENKAMLLKGYVEAMEKGRDYKRQLRELQQSGDAQPEDVDFLNDMIEVHEERASGYRKEMNDSKKPKNG